jgi:hypothetical protein
MAASVALREPLYETVVVGEEIGPIPVSADEHYLKNAMFAVDDYSVARSNDDRPLVPQAAVARNLVALFCRVYDPNRVVGLHQREEIWFHREIPLGTRMLYSGRYTDKYERRGKGYVVFEAEARDASDGALLVRQVSTEIMRIPENVVLGQASAAPPERRVSGEWPSDMVPVARYRPGLEPGTPVAPLTKVAHQDQMSVFSGADFQWSNIHTDIRVAQRAGFRDTLAQGAMESCWTAQMLTDVFGNAFRRTGWIRHVYLKPVFRGDSVVCRGKIISVDKSPEGSETIELEAWCTNQDGVMTAAGWAGLTV